MLSYYIKDICCNCNGGDMDNIKLFNKLKEYEIDELLGFLHATTKVFSKNSIIINKGAKLSDICIVLVGEVNIYAKNIDGGESLIKKVGAGSSFCLNYVCAGIKTSPVVVRAEKQTGVLFLPYDRTLILHESVSKWQQQLLKNIFEEVARENLDLNARMDVLNQKTIREKILFYLNRIVDEVGSNKVEIPFSREEMAGYLCVDRSALSRELSNLHKDEILNYKKNEFHLLS